MNKLLYSFILIGSIYLTTFTVHAVDGTPTPVPAVKYVIEVQPAPDPTPTVAVPPGTQCGAVGLQCCGIAENTQVTTGQTFDICVPWFWRVCISDMLAGIMGNFTVGIKDLTAAQTCNTSGVPQFKEDPPNSGSFSCMCADLPTENAESSALCDRYVAPNVMRRIGTGHSTKSFFNERNPLNPFVDYTLDYNLLKNDKEYNACFNCFEQGGYYSSLGCIYTDNWKDLIEKNIFGWGLGLAGIIAVGCITFAALQFQLSQGDPEKIKKSRELITSCIMGLMLIIFSVFILKVIGVDILAVPGFK
jgi:hypothetical protein